MKWSVRSIIARALKSYDVESPVELIPAKNDADFATNAALKAAKILKRKPVEVAHDLAKLIASDAMIAKAEVVPPGFINIYLKPEVFTLEVASILKAGADFGRGRARGYINVEYVSANPTGYLHIGTARNAALGSTLVNVLRFAGNSVDSEYYINDMGSQIDILGASTFARYQQELGQKVELPQDAYQGMDIVDCAKFIVSVYGDKFRGLDYQDVKDLFRQEAKRFFLHAINEDLVSFNVVIDHYFSEKTLYDAEQIERTLVLLQDYTYNKDDALWLATTKFGDDKDRVLRKSDGQYTYFMPDIAYHHNKLLRGYGELIDVWGADHIGYVQRMKSAVQVLSFHRTHLSFLIVQLVKLMREGSELKMSKRRGTTFTMRELVAEVGVDAARWFVLDRAASSEEVVDLDIALVKSNDNPLFTIQYAHARAHQLLAKSTKHPAAGPYEAKERKIINHISLFPELVQDVAHNHKVHLIAQYLLELARLFNSWYSNSRVIDSERELALLAIAAISKNTLAQGLNLLGISSPTQV